MPISSSFENDTTNSRFAAQLPRNLMANVIIGISLLPYFIATFGVEAYRLFPLATSISGYVAIVVQSLNTIVTRDLSVDLQQENYAATNMIFSRAIYNNFCWESLKHLGSHADYLSVTALNVENSTATVVVAHFAVQTYYFGVA